ncbi:hypothetical protein ACOMHN_059715 [Nucella lapillus]
MYWPCTSSEQLTWSTDPDTPPLQQQTAATDPVPWSDSDSSDDDDDDTDITDDSQHQQGGPGQPLPLPQDPWEDLSCPEKQDHEAEPPSVDGYSSEGSIQLPLKEEEEEKELSSHQGEKEEEGRFSHQEEEEGRFFHQEEEEGRFSHQEEEEGRFSHQEEEEGRFSHQEKEEGRFFHQEEEEGRFSHQEEEEGRFSHQEEEEGRFSHQEEEEGRFFHQEEEEGRFSHQEKEEKGLLPPPPPPPTCQGEGGQPSSACSPADSIPQTARSPLCDSNGSANSLSPSLLGTVTFKPKIVTHALSSSPTHEGIDADNVQTLSDEMPDPSSVSRNSKKSLPATKETPSAGEQKLNQRGRESAKSAAICAGPQGERGGQQQQKKKGPEVTTCVVPEGALNLLSVLSVKFPAADRQGGSRPGSGDTRSLQERRETLRLAPTRARLLTARADSATQRSEDSQGPEGSVDGSINQGVEGSVDESIHPGMERSLMEGPVEEWVSPDDLSSGQSDSLNSSLEVVLSSPEDTERSEKEVRHEDGSRRRLKASSGHEAMAVSYKHSCQCNSTSCKITRECNSTSCKNTPECSSRSGKNTRDCNSRSSKSTRECNSKSGKHTITRSDFSRCDKLVDDRNQNVHYWQHSFIIDRNDSSKSETVHQDRGRHHRQEKRKNVVDALGGKSGSSIVSQRRTERSEDGCQASCVYGVFSPPILLFHLEDNNHPRPAPQDAGQLQHIPRFTQRYIHTEQDAQEDVILLDTSQPQRPTSYAPVYHPSHSRATQRIGSPYLHVARFMENSQPKKPHQSKNPQASTYLNELGIRQSRSAPARVKPEGEGSADFRQTDVPGSGGISHARSSKPIEERARSAVTRTTSSSSSSVPVYATAGHRLGSPRKGVPLPRTHRSSMLVYHDDVDDMVVVGSDCAHRPGRSPTSTVLTYRPGRSPTSTVLTHRPRTSLPSAGTPHKATASDLQPARKTRVRWSDLQTRGVSGPGEEVDTSLPAPPPSPSPAGSEMAARSKVVTQAAGMKVEGVVCKTLCEDSVGTAEDQ